MTTIIFDENGHRMTNPMTARMAVVGSIERAERAVNQAQGDLKRYMVDIECSQKDVFD
jgi:hypothetical protein